MWLQHKPKNRRLGRDHVLDVKLRSSQARAARTRAATVALAVVVGAALGIHLILRGGEWALDQLVYDNKAFAIEEVDVQTDGIIPVNQLRRWTGVRLGENLLALDLARVRRDLGLISLIQSVSVERVLPHTLRVRVGEREPVAQVNVFKPGSAGGVETTPFQLDAEGYVIVPLDPRQRGAQSGQIDNQLPLICGLNPNEVQAGRKIDLPQVRAALELLVAFEHSPMQDLVDLKSIDVSAREVLLATTTQQSQISFSLRDIDRQMRRWRKIFELAQLRNKAIASLDLAVSNSVPVVFQELGTLPPPAPKPPKQLKQKHV